MKAVLLAAGAGTRLRPLTDRVPKCLMPVGGVPLLERWLRIAADLGCDEVLVNTHHLAGAVERFVEQRAAPWWPTVRLAHEPTLLGSAGTLKANGDFLTGGPFLCVYADNFADVRFDALTDAHARHGLPATLGLFKAPDPRQCGIATLDAAGVMIGFVEKPSDPASDLANAGLYVFSPEVLELIPDDPPVDLGFDLLPRLVGRAVGVPIEGEVVDIGTPLGYARANLMECERAGRLP